MSSTIPDVSRPPAHYRCEPGRTLLLDLAAGSVIAAVDGRVRVLHRDASLDGIEGLSSRVSLVLEEGRAWTTPRHGPVEAWTLDGAATVAVTRAARRPWWAGLREAFAPASSRSRPATR